MSFKYKVIWIAEKWSQAEKYSKAFANAKKGYIKEDKIGNFLVCSDPDYYNGLPIVITWASGHLLELQEPEDYDKSLKQWSMETLPIIPSEFLYKVSSSNISSWKTIEYFLNMCDTVVWATDIDREGSHIAYLLSYYTGALFDDTKTFKRLRVKDLLPSTIRKGFKNMEDIEKSKLQGMSGQTRAISDWLIGINGTRYINLLLKELGFDIPTSVGKASIGRVMTVVLFIVYWREQRIETFQPETYFNLSCQFEHKNGTYIGKLVVPDITMNNGKKWKGKLEKEEQWNSFISKYAPQFNQGTITSLDTDVKYTRSPTLFSLSELQQVMNKSIGISPSKTLSIVQKLYDPKGKKSKDSEDTEVSEDAYLTYPRSSSNCITEEEYYEISKMVYEMADWIGVSHDSIVIRDKPDSFFVNDKVCTDSGHSAITPTKNLPSVEIFESWDNDTKSVYMEVFKRTLAIFLPKYKYSQNVIITSVENLDFKTTNNTALEEGWKVLWDSKEDDNVEQKDSKVKVELHDTVKPHKLVNKVVTKPPSLYTEGTLLEAMLSCGNKVAEDEELDEEMALLTKVMKEIEGIGTEATRGETIKKLFDIKQLTIQKRKVRTTTLGKLICRILEDEIIFSDPFVTARWEVSLSNIEKGQNTQDKFLANIYKYLGVDSPERNLFVNLKNKIANLDLSEFDDFKKEIEHRKNPIIEVEGVFCPSCKGQVKMYDDYIVCSNRKKDNPDTCNFILSNYVGRFKKDDSKGGYSGGKKLTSKQIIDLLLGKEVAVKGIKSKKATKYNATVSIKYDDARGTYSMNMKYNQKGI